MAELTTAPPGPAPSPKDAPRPSRLPPGRRAARWLATSWRLLTSMRTALFLLFLLAVAAVPGSLVPQRGIDPLAVQAFFRNHPALAPVLDRLSLFDVFAAPWFAAIYLLLCLSLAGCVVPRLRTFVGALRARPPAAPRRLDRLPWSQTWTTAEEPAVVSAAAARVLRRSRYRVDETVAGPGPGSVSVNAERGYLHEAGNLLFHGALLLLLAGVAIGGLYGYKGTVLVREGDGFANTRTAYDEFHPGRLFVDGELAPFGIALRQFRATYQPNGEARTFDALVTYTSTPTSPPRPYDIAVNHPLRVGGAKVYLVGHGYAPRFVVRGADGAVAYDSATVFLPQDADFTSVGVVKVPDARPQQLAFSGFFLPTAAPSPSGFVSVFPDDRSPAVTLLAWRGNLGLDQATPQSVYQLDTRRLSRIGAFLLRPGDTARLPGGGSVTFAGVSQYATLHVTHDPGRGLALAGAVAAVLGVLLSLRVRRRRVWLRARVEDGGATLSAPRTVVEVAALARADVTDLGTEMAPLAGRLRRATSADGGPAAGPAGSGRED